MHRLVMGIGFSLILAMGIGCDVDYHHDCNDHDGPRHDWDRDNDIDEDFDEAIDEGLGGDAGPSEDAGEPDADEGPVVGDCMSDSDCDTNFVCLANECSPVADTCQFNYQCAGGTCINNTCVASCTEDSDCGSGLTCNGTQCVPVEECGEVTGTVCEAGQTCVDYACLDACTADTDCAEGDYCSAGFCQFDPRPKPFCTSNDDCATDHVCVDGACRTPCPTQTSAECQTFDSQLPVCAADNLCYSRNETNPECRSASDCPTDQACIDAICR